MLDDPSLPHGRPGPEDRHLKNYELWDNLHATDFGHMTGWGWGMMLLLVVLAVAGVVSLFLVITYWARGPAPGRDSSRADPEEILADRFARGEIDEEEFHARRAALRSDA